MLKYALAVLLLAVQDPVEKGKSPSRPLPGKAPEELAKLLAAYEIEGKDFAWELAPLKGGAGKYSAFQLTFPSALKTEVEENNTVWCKAWIPADGAAKHPAVILLHWLKGSFEVLEMVGAMFASQGIVAVMPTLPHYGKRRGPEKEKDGEMISADLERTMEGLRQAVLDVRRTGDWLAARPDVDPDRIGLMGISLGAIVGSLAAGVDPNIKRSVLVIGGGDLPAICLNGSKEAKRIKKKLEEEGWTEEKLRERWKGIEPLTFASRVDPASVLMINAEKDEVIPRAATEKLWEAFGKPKITWMKGTHYTIAVQVASILKESAEHLSRPVEQKK